MDFQREFVALTLNGLRYYGIGVAVIILLISAWNAWQDNRKRRPKNQIYTEFGVMAVIDGELSRVLKIDIGRVSVKASSANGLGMIGRGEGIAAHAVALIEGGKNEDI